MPARLNAVNPIYSTISNSYSLSMHARDLVGHVDFWVFTRQSRFVARFLTVREETIIFVHKSAKEFQFKRDETRNGVSLEV